jgi:hypothetical protein
MHIISSSQNLTLFPLHRNTHILFSEIHIISSSENYTYPLHTNAHYILFSDRNNKFFSADKHNMSFSQIYTISSPNRNTVSSFQINKLYILPWYNHYILCTVTHYLLFSDKRPISSCQIKKLFPFLRYTNHILFSGKHTIFSSQICKLYPLLR